MSPREAAISEKLISTFGGSPMAADGHDPPRAGARHDPGARELVERAPKRHPADAEMLCERAFGRQTRPTGAPPALDLPGELFPHPFVAQAQPVERGLGIGVRRHAAMIDPSKTRENRN